MHDEIIRPFADPDWPSVWPIVRQVAAAGDTFTLPVDLDEDLARAIWLERPPGQTVVAVDGTGAVIATAKMGPNKLGPGDHVATASFMVADAHRGQGLGRRLGEHALAWARRSGYRGMQFNAVVECNSRAVGLWQHLGFHIVGTVPGAFRHPSDGFVGLHIMYKAL